MRWLAVTFTAAALLFLGDQPAGKLPDPGFSFPGLDKLAHALGYGVLGAVTAWAARSASWTRALLVGVAAGLLVGALDEWNQQFSPGRSADAWDLLADVVGSAAGALVFRWRRPRS
ncbi:MAG: VanZ family protein [Planctomycetota bacterium]